LIGRRAIRRNNPASDGFDYALVLGVRADPKPSDFVAGAQAQGAIAKTDPRRPNVVSYSLEPQAWMPRVPLEPLIRFVSKLPNWPGQLPARGPEIRGRVRFQSFCGSSGRARPAPDMRAGAIRQPAKLIAASRESLVPPLVVGFEQFKQAAAHLVLFVIGKLLRRFLEGAP
jgi:hypothetical protein